MLVNNASSFYPTPIDTTTEAEWDDLVGTNLKAPFFVTKAAARFIAAGRGSVVNLADIHGRNPVAGYPAYCAAKAGLIMLTRAMALELGPEVRVNAVAPGTPCARRRPRKQPIEGRAASPAAWPGSPGGRPTR